MSVMDEMNLGVGSFSSMLKGQQAEIKRLKEQNTRMLAMLRKLADEMLDSDCGCWVCRCYTGDPTHRRVYVHAHDCELAALLKEFE